MSKPYIHAISSARKYGGILEDYIDIHNFMDSSKSTIADNRHRALTHNSWFISTIIEKVFGNTRVNSDNKIYSTKQIAEDHVLEDYAGKYIPAACDFLQELEFKDWMDNGRSTTPPSNAKLYKNNREKEIIKFNQD